MKNYSMLPRETRRVVKEPEPPKKEEQTDERGHGRANPSARPEALLLATAFSSNPARAALIADSVKPHLTDEERDLLDMAKERGSELARCTGMGRLRVLSRCLRPGAPRFDRSIDRFERTEQLLRAMRTRDMSALLPSMLGGIKPDVSALGALGSNGMAGLLSGLLGKK